MLLSNDDIFLLDEPTNNLDIEAITWLEKYLKSLNKKMIKAYAKKTIKIKEQNNLFSKNIEKVEIDFSNKTNEKNINEEEQIKEDIAKYYEIDKNLINVKIK